MINHESINHLSAFLAAPLTVCFFLGFFSCFPFFHVFYFLTRSHFLRIFLFFRFTSPFSHSISAYRSSFLFSRLAFLAFSLLFFLCFLLPFSPLSFL